MEALGGPRLRLQRASIPSRRTDLNVFPVLAASGPRSGAPSNRRTIGLVCRVRRTSNRGTGQPHGTPRVQEEFGQFPVAVGLVDPLAGETHQGFQILIGAERLG